MYIKSEWKNLPFHLETFLRNPLIYWFHRKQNSVQL